jgi:hypothetical protein
MRTSSLVFFGSHSGELFEDDTSVAIGVVMLYLRTDLGPAEITVFSAVEQIKK